MGLLHKYDTNKTLNGPNLMFAQDSSPSFGLYKDHALENLNTPARLKI